jgi:hypothetical protein
MAASGEPVKIRAVISINAIKANLPIPDNLPSVPPVVSEVTRPSMARVLPAASRSLIPFEQSLDLLKRMKECPYRTDETGCGCGGMAKCALGKGREGLVNHLDCFTCLGYTPNP